MAGAKLSDDHDLLSSNDLQQDRNKRAASRGRFEDGLRVCNGCLASMRVVALVGC